jgi:hypothetical protein
VLVFTKTVAPDPRDLPCASGVNGSYAITFTMPSVPVVTSLSSVTLFCKTHATGVDGRADPMTAAHIDHRHRSILTGSVARREFVAAACAPGHCRDDARGFQSMSMFSTSDGTEIRYEVRGSGWPVAVCHGGPNNICNTLMRDLAPLEDSYALIFHDYRGGAGSAAAAAATYRFDRLSDDLDELRVHLGHESMSVVAHSMGGFVALQYALRHPETCRRLALIATTPCGVARRMAIPVLKALGPLRTAKALVLAARFVGLWSWRRPSRERTTAMYAR